MDELSDVSLTVPLVVRIDCSSSHFLGLFRVRCYRFSSCFSGFIRVRVLYYSGFEGISHCVVGVLFRTQYSIFVRFSEALYISSSEWRRGRGGLPYIWS